MSSRFQTQATVVALLLSIGLAMWIIFPAWTEPGAWLIGNWVHPDCLSNHWLLVWVAEQLQSGGSILHNDHYYWPVGDAPVLAGNGAEGFIYLPFHAALGWPQAVVPYIIATLTLGCMSGWVLARAIGADPWSALLTASVVGLNPYTIQELSSGRFSQVNSGWLILFLAAWIHLLAKPSRSRAVIAGILLAITSFFYWYYGLFGVIAGATFLLLLSGTWWRRGGPDLRRFLQSIVVFTCTFGLLIGPWALVFYIGWDAVPGIDEGVAFPHPQALLDAARPALPFMVQKGRHVGQAMSVLPWAIGLAGALMAIRGTRTTTPDGLRRACLVVWVLFTLLSWGPLFHGAPYTLLYGLAEPLRRFWWPVRHVVVSNAIWAALAAWALSRWLQRWKRTAPRAAVGLTLALISPVLLHLQGAPTHASIIPLALPPPAYPALADEPGGVLVEPPISPKASGSQQHLILQIFHNQKLLSGHAPWVDRVRPDEWDAFIADNSFLTALQRLELGENPGVVQFDPADLQALIEADVRWFALNRTYFTLDLQPLVRSYRALFDGLFGPAVHRGKGIWIWRAENWNGRHNVAVPEWTWPLHLRPLGPDMPLSGKRPNSPVFFARRPKR